jgi:tetratricopeptide (TPR) repeat protein
MSSEWETRVANFWASADDSKVVASLATMKTLVDELDPQDPNGLYEWASVHDFLGLESQAIDNYKDALANGLEGVKREKAIIQLASSLRIVGKSSEAIELLQSTEFSPATKAASKVFLALAHFSANNAGKAVQLLIDELYPADGLYARSIKFYADELGERGSK